MRTLERRIGVSTGNPSCDPWRSSRASALEILEN
jgi:hypothetical protein